MFHHFHNKAHPKVQGSISQEEFEDILNFVGIGRILNSFDWLEKLGEGRLSKEDVCITLDDSLLCQFEIALPVLEKFNLTAFWFVYSSVFEGTLEKMEIYRFFRTTFFQSIDDFYGIFFKRIFNSEVAKKAQEVLEEGQIKKLIEQFPFYSANDAKFRLIRDCALGKEKYERIMDEMILECGVSISDLSKRLWMCNDHLGYLSGHGHVVGLHSYSHPMVFTNLSYQEQFEQYQKNYIHIKTVCQCTPVAMSHPVNSYDEDTLKILKNLGICCGFRANMLAKSEGGRLNPTNLEIAREDNANIVRMLRRGHES